MKSAYRNSRRHASESSSTVPHPLFIPAYRNSNSYKTTPFAVPEDCSDMESCSAAVIHVASGTSRRTSSISPSSCITLGNQDPRSGRRSTFPRMVRLASTANSAASLQFEKLCSFRITLLDNRNLEFWLKVRIYLFLNLFMHRLQFIYQLRYTSIFSFFQSAISHYSVIFFSKLFPHRAISVFLKSIDHIVSTNNYRT